MLVVGGWERRRRAACRPASQVVPSGWCTGLHGHPSVQRSSRPRLTPAPLSTTLLFVIEMSFLSRKRPGGTATVTPVPLAA